MVLVEIRRKRPDPRDEVCQTGSQTASYWRSPSPGTHILVWFPPLECGQDWDRFLANRTWQRERAVASMTTWQKTVASVPLVHSPCCDEKMAVVRTGESKDWTPTARETVLRQTLIGHGEATNRNQRKGLHYFLYRLHSRIVMSNLILFILYIQCLVHQKGLIKIYEGSQN